MLTVKFLMHLSIATPPHMPKFQLLEHGYDSDFLTHHLITVLFLKSTWHHSYLTKKRREMTLMIMELAMQITTTSPLSILLGAFKIEIEKRRRIVLEMKSAHLFA